MTNINPWEYISVYDFLSETHYSNDANVQSYNKLFESVPIEHINISPHNGLITNTTNPWQIISLFDNIIEVDDKSNAYITLLDTDTNPTNPWKLLYSSDDTEEYEKGNAYQLLFTPNTTLPNPNNWEQKEDFSIVDHPWDNPWQIILTGYEIPETDHNDVADKRDAYDLLHALYENDSDYNYDSESGNDFPVLDQFFGSVDPLDDSEGGNEGNEDDFPVFGSGTAPEPLCPQLPPALRF